MLACVQDDVSHIFLFVSTPYFECNERSTGLRPRWRYNVTRSAKAVSSKDGRTKVVHRVHRIDIVPATRNAVGDRSRKGSDGRLSTYENGQCLLQTELLAWHAEDAELSPPWSSPNRRRCARVL